MKKVVICALMVLFVFSGSKLAFAKKDKDKGASAQAYEHASDEAIFNRVGDWFATVGKSEEEKEEIKAERQANRERKRVEKQAQKELKQAEKEMNQAVNRERNRERNEEESELMNQDKNRESNRLLQQYDMQSGSGFATQGSSGRNGKGGR